MKAWNKAWSHMAAKAQPAKPTLAATSSMPTIVTNQKNKNKMNFFKKSLAAGAMKHLHTRTLKKVIFFILLKTGNTISSKF
jgi:hypothetical protein